MYVRAKTFLLKILWSESYFMPHNSKICDPNLIPRQ